MERNKNRGFVVPICFKCKHYHGAASYKCDAFPVDIPNEILIGENDHSKPLPDQDNEIVFEKAGK